MFYSGVLGINRRNIDYIKKFNPNKGIRLVDDKYKTKEFLSVRGIPVPQTYARIISRQELFEFDFGSLPVSNFVIKPTHGSKGKGIYVTRRIDELPDSPTEHLWERYINTFYNLVYAKYPHFPYGYMVGDKAYTDRQFKSKLVSILEGNYTLGNRPDSILIEEKLLPGSGFDDFCSHGLADIRIIVCNLVPVIAMVRMPTSLSGGKANLAQGGLGLGVDIVSGKIQTLYLHKKTYKDNFPPEYAHLYGKRIAFWDDLLVYSSNVQYFLNMGYVGIDRVITNQGPKILEVNGKAGLEIQNVVLMPLQKILAKIDDLHISSPQKGVEIAKSLLGSEKPAISQPKVLYLSQKGLLQYQTKTQIRETDVIVTTNLQKKKNYIHPKFLRKLLIDITSPIALELPDSRIVIKNMLLHKSETVKSGTIQLGSLTIQDYYLKPVHKLHVAINTINPDKLYDEEITTLQIFDQKLFDIYKKIRLSSLLKPVNYLDEFDKFISKRGAYDPVFTYQFPRSKEIFQILGQLQELEDTYRSKSTCISPFAKLLFDKIDETYDMIMLLQAYKEQDFQKIMNYNTKLFGSIHKSTVKKALEYTTDFESYKATKFGRLLKGDAVEKYIKDYTKQYIPGTIKIERSTATLSRISVVYQKKAKIRIMNNVSFREHELQAQLKHEFNTHYYRYRKGQKTGRKILTHGTAGYIIDEEGLAIYQALQYIKNYIPEYCNISMYNKYLLAVYAQQYSFSQLATYAQEMIWKKGSAMTMKGLFNALVKVKKGIIHTDVQHPGAVFLKNIVYLQGYDKLIQRIEKGNQIDRLLIGKVKIDDLDCIE